MHISKYKDYEVVGKYKPDMRKMKVLARSKSGKNQVFVDEKTRKTYTRKDLVTGILNDEIIGGHIRIIQGIQVPCKNKQ